jgi:2-polyprenyl-6-hydroxyphenyl methylase/3-demethylubiquinone-9 3-methyltransferase
MTNLANTIDNDEIERFSRIAEEWWDENGKFKPLHRMGHVRLQYLRDQACAHFNRDTDQLRTLNGLTVLDVGCGGGLLSEPMARLGTQVTGIDASEKNIAVAALHARNMGLEIDYRCTSPETLTQANAKKPLQYDIVLALEIVEHVSDVPAFIKACAGLVKPGGLLFMSTLNRTVKSYIFAIAAAEYILRWLPRGTHQWNKFLKPSELCAGIRKEGLRVNHMSGIVFNPAARSWHLAEKDLDVNYILTATKALNSN